MATKLIIVGGFLGSGKTTMLWKAARELGERGLSVGLITNDQAPDLVDTAFLSKSGAGVEEVAGSCFCCNFNGFLSSVKSLMDRKADIIIAEPVGSCTDLSATIMQPLKDKHPEIELAPLSVLVDPIRIEEALLKRPSAIHASALYILRLQMEEADLILLNKIDRLGAEERRVATDLLRRTFPNVALGEISARSGEGVDEWLNASLSGEKAGTRIVDIDYDRNAEGEAVFGWLNASVELETSCADSEWGKVAEDLLGRLHNAFKLSGSEIGHVKLIIKSDAGECLLNLTRLDGAIERHGDASIVGHRADLVLNARAQMPPDRLEDVVKNALGTVSSKIKTSIRALRCLMPGRPNPTHRYSHTI